MSDEKPKQKTRTNVQVIVPIKLYEAFKGHRFLNGHDQRKGLEAAMKLYILDSQKRNYQKED